VLNMEGMKTIGKFKHFFVFISNEQLKGSDSERFAACFPPSILPKNGSPTTVKKRSISEVKINNILHLIL
jgi:hypothetical protein